MKNSQKSVKANKLARKVFAELIEAGIEIEIATMMAKEMYRQEMKAK